MIEQLKCGLEAEVTPTRMLQALGELEPNTSQDELRALADVLVDLVHRVPDTLACALSLAKDDKGGKAIAFATGSILNYVFDPDDLFPESEYGALGLLDDTYLVHAFVSQIVNAYPFVAPPATYSAPSQQSLDVLSSILPDGVAPALARTAATIILVAQALFVPGPDGREDAANSPIELRLSGAIRALRQPAGD